MSEESLPLRQWPAGIQQASVPANENALRLQALLSRALSVENDAPGTEYDGAVYIVGSSPTGAFDNFSENDIALYEFGSWYAWAPVMDTSMVVNDVRKVFDGAAWIDDPSVAGGGGGSNSYTIVTEASASTATVGTNDGLTKYNRCGGDVTFDDAQPYTSGMSFNIRATASIELVEDGVTLTPPAGGTLQLEANMAVQVVMTGPTTGDVIGQTEVTS